MAKDKTSTGEKKDWPTQDLVKTAKISKRVYTDFRKVAKLKGVLLSELLRQTTAQYADELEKTRYPINVKGGDKHLVAFTVTGEIYEKIKYKWTENHNCNTYEVIQHLMEKAIEDYLKHNPSVSLDSIEEVPIDKDNKPRKTGVRVDLYFTNELLKDVFGKASAEKRTLSEVMRFYIPQFFEEKEDNYDRYLEFIKDKPLSVRTSINVSVEQDDQVEAYARKKYPDNPLRKKEIKDDAGNITGYTKEKCGKSGEVYRVILAYIWEKMFQK